MNGVHTHSGSGVRLQNRMSHWVKAEPVLQLLSRKEEKSAAPCCWLISYLSRFEPGMEFKAEKEVSEAGGERQSSADSV